MKKKIISMLVLLTMAVSLLACGSESSAETTTAQGGDETAESKDENGGGETFKIGAFLPLSGASAAYGIEARNGIQLALDYVNENGGFNGADGELVVYDTQCSVEEAVKVVSKLLQEDKVDAMIGSILSSEIFATGNAINKAGVYMLGTGLSPSWMEEDWPYIFRAALNSADSVPANIEMMKELGYQTAAAFYGQDDASVATYEVFAEVCEEQGIEVVNSESYDQGDTDYAAQVTNIVNSGAECVFISVIGETAPVIVKQLRQYGFDGIIFDKESFMATQVEIAGVENSNYTAFTNPYVTYNSVEEIDIENVKEFAQKYEEVYGEINKTDSAYRGWDPVLVMWEASKIAGSNDSEALKDATNQIDSLEGLGGTLNFTAGDREGYKDLNKFILVDGKSVLWSEWIEDGGYDAFLEATGREK